MLKPSGRKTRNRGIIPLSFLVTGAGNLMRVSGERKVETLKRIREWDVWDWLVVAIVVLLVAVVIMALWGLGVFGYRL